MRKTVSFDYNSKDSIRDHIRCFLAAHYYDADVELCLPSGLILRFSADRSKRTAYIGDLAVFEFTEDQLRCSISHNFETLTFRYRIS
jgi:hypothetical protein